LRREAAALLVALFFVSPDEIEGAESVARAVRETMPR
jgi:hypothetical protein